LTELICSVDEIESTEPFSGHGDRIVTAWLLLAERLQDLGVILQRGRHVQTELVKPVTADPQAAVAVLPRFAYHADQSVVDETGVDMLGSDEGLIVGQLVPVL